MRLIDADALDWECIEHKYGARDDAVVDCEIMIDIAPTIDAVPVVRCKDCKWWHDNGTLTGFCERLGTLEWYGTDATDFCSFAERKDDEID